MSDTAHRGGGSVERPERGVRGRRVLTSALAFLLFLASMVFLMWFQERSIILTCLQLPDTELATCLPGAEALEGVGGTVEEPERDAIAKALGAKIEPAKSRFAVQIALLGALAAGAVTLMLLVLFPADVLKFDGSFKHGSSNLRFGGAVGVFLLVAAAGGYLAYRSIPAAEQYESVRGAAIRSQAEAAKMHKNYTDLVAGIGDRQHDYARNLLVHGYFRKMRGTYVIHCDVESANESARRGSADLPRSEIVTAGVTAEASSIQPGSDLRVHFGSGQRRPHVNFDIPIDKLSPGNESAVNMTLKRDVSDLNLVDLSRTTFDIRETALASGLNDSILYVKTEINQGQLERYCADREPVMARSSKTRGELQ